MKVKLQSKPWHIIGAGALGCLWIYYCRASGLDLTLLLRNRARLTEFTDIGGVALLVDGRPELQACAAQLPEQLAAAQAPTPIEQLIICCKAQQTVSAFTSVANLLAKNATVLLLQNGMGVAEELLAIKPGMSLFCGVSTDGAHLVSPFTVQRAGVGVTRIGLFPAEPGMAMSRELCKLLAVAGLTLEPCANIKLAQWQKLAVNAVINPLTALFDINNGKLLTLAEPGAMVAPLCAEIASVARAEGMALNADSIEAEVHRVCRLTSANISSMLQDVRQRRDTELAYINGFLQRCAARHGIDTPLNRQLISKLEQHRKTVARLRAHTQASTYKPC
jgi:2-dehydropantoate 2-reductase